MMPLVAYLPNTASEKLASTAGTLGSMESGEMVSSLRGFLDLQRKTDNKIGIGFRFLIA